MKILCFKTMSKGEPILERMQAIRCSNLITNTIGIIWLLFLIKCLNLIDLWLGEDQRTNNIKT